MRQFAALLLLATPLWGCGGRSGTIQLNIITSPADDPFADATSVRFTVGADLKVQTAPVSMGHFTISIDQKPQMSSAIISVDALDASGQVIAYGRTPMLSLQAADQGPYGVWVGRPARIVPAADKLPSARSAIASAAFNLGVLYAGGLNANNAPVPDAAVYDVFTQTVIVIAPMASARAGAVATRETDVKAAVFGGTTQAAPGQANSAPLGSVEILDPTVGLGLWSPLAGNQIDARSLPSTARLKSGALLISGGFDAAGGLLASAGLLTTDGSPQLNAVGSPMVAARQGHVSVAAHFPESDGAILFGGLAPGSASPVAERLVGQSFSAYDMGDLGKQKNRVAAAATLLLDGRMLVVGGRDDTGVLQSGFIIDPQVPALVTQLPTALSAAREGHSATLSDPDIVVCGGADNLGQLVPSCDILDATSGTLVATIPLGTARRDHSAELIDTGQVIIAGGIGQNGPLDSIEIYTPRIKTQ